MPRHIRMPNGTVIRNVPDDITKEQFRQKFIANFGEEKWQQLLTPADPTQTFDPEQTDERPGDTSAEFTPAAAPTGPTPQEKIVEAAERADFSGGGTPLDLSGGGERLT